MIRKSFINSLALLSYIIPFKSHFEISVCTLWYIGDLLLVTFQKCTPNCIHQKTISSDRMLMHESLLERKRKLLLISELSIKYVPRAIHDFLSRNTLYKILVKETVWYNLIERKSLMKKQYRFLQTWLSGWFYNIEVTRNALWTRKTFSPWWLDSSMSSWIWR